MRHFSNQVLTDANKTKTGDSQPRQIQGHQKVTWPGGLLLSNWLKPDLPYPGLLLDFLLVSTQVQR